MASDLEKARIMFKLTRKNNWGNCYDRTEHFKRFEGLDAAIKGLSKSGWLIIHKKQKFTGISLNTACKGEIIGFIETNMPHLKGIIK